MTPAIQSLLADARKSCLVSAEMVRRAFALNAPIRLVWCAAGAGLADFHRSRGMVCNLEAALGDDADKLPAAYFEGYKLEALRAEYMELERNA